MTLIAAPRLPGKLQQRSAKGSQRRERMDLKPGVLYGLKTSRHFSSVPLVVRCSAIELVTDEGGL